MKIQGKQVLRVVEGKRISKEEFDRVRASKHHFYPMRHADNDMSIPITIEPRVIVNYWGYVVTSEPLTYTETYAPEYPPSIIKLTEEEGYDLVDMRDYATT
ncbi:hypothetical protein RKD55_004713 [Rossellomorea marisflavi]